MLLTILSNASALFMLWIFAQAGVHKLMPSNTRYYNDLIGQYLNSQQTISDKSNKQKYANSINHLVKFIGTVELLLAILVVIPLSRTLATTCIIAILFAYMCLMAYQLQQGKRELDCGCSGSASHLKISGALIIRNCIFSVIALACFTTGNIEFSLNIFIVFLIALAAISLNAIIEQLIANEQQLILLKS